MIRRPFTSDDQLPGPAFWRQAVNLVNSRQIKTEAPLEHSQRPDGKTQLALKPGLEMLAIVVGHNSFSGYGCVEAWFQPGAGQRLVLVAKPDGRVIVNAFSYNPDDQVDNGTGVLLRYTRVGDWRFEVIRDGAPGGPGTGSTNPPTGCCPSRTPPTTLYLTCKYGTVPLTLRNPAAFGVGIMNFSTDPRSPDTWWEGVIWPYDPLTLSEVPCINRTSQCATVRLPVGGGTYVTYGLECTPMDYWNLYLGRRVQGFNFWVVKVIYAGQAQLTPCSDPCGIPSFPLPFYPAPVPFGVSKGGGVLLGAPASCDPCHISISVFLPDTPQPNGLPPGFSECHGAPETVTISE